MRLSASEWALRKHWVNAVHSTSMTTEINFNAKYFCIARLTPYWAGKTRAYLKFIKICLFASMTIHLVDCLSSPNYLKTEQDSLALSTVCGTLTQHRQNVFKGFQWTKLPYFYSCSFWLDVPHQNIEVQKMNVRMMLFKNIQSITYLP